MSKRVSHPDTGSMHVRDRVAGPGSRLTSAGLVLLYAPEPERLPPAFLFKKAEIVVGREGGADIVIGERGVSKRHAVIRHADDKWWIRDAGSTNGTIVQGELACEEVELEPLDEVRFGDAIFAFVGVGAEAYVRHRIDGVVLGESVDEAAKRRARTVTGGARMDKLLHRAARVAPSAVSVLITGETGTGKEVLARHLHEASGRTGPLLALNCAAIAETLLDAELFGVVKGAYSGADRDRQGLFRAAHGGTLFLDEVGELSLAAQAKLLRAVQEKAVTPVGGTAAEVVDVRILSATHRDLGAMEKARTFRADLHARLKEFSLHLPPLRERKEDVYLLCTELLRREGRALHLSVPFMTGILHYDYPHNIRELASMLRVAGMFCEGDTLHAADLPEEIKAAMVGYGVRADAAAERGGQVAAAQGGEVKEGRGGEVAEGEPDTERDRPGPPPIEDLVQVLADCKGNLAAVGRAYDKMGTTVRRWLKLYGLRAEDFR